MTSAVFTRGLHDVTERVPEVVDVVRALPGGELVLDGEAIALQERRRPPPFQVTMRRFGRRLDVAALREERAAHAVFLRHPARATVAT